LLLREKPGPSHPGFNILAFPFLTGKRGKSDQNVKTKGIEITVTLTATVEHFDFQVHSFGKGQKHIEAFVAVTDKIISWHGCILTEIFV